MPSETEGHDLAASRAMGEHFLVVERMFKTFASAAGAIEALRDLTFSVDKGTFVAVLGPSACGKTTLLRVVGGLIAPSRGTVVLDGHVVRGPGRDRGMVFQSYTSFPWLNVRQNVEFGLALRGIDEAERRRVSERFIGLVGLSGFENAYPVALSGGMKQRVAIARTLANDPAILLMDEPFGALDYQTRWGMQDLLLHVCEETRKTVLFVTHDIEEGLFLADRVLVMTRSPGQVKKEIHVPFPRPRDAELRATPELATAKKEVMSLVRTEASGSQDPYQHSP